MILTSKTVSAHMETQPYEFETCIYYLFVTKSKHSVMMYNTEEYCIICTHQKTNYRNCHKDNFK